MKRVITVLVGLIMIAGAFGHVFSPETYVAMIPAFIPSAPANILAAIIEFIIGLALLHPTYSKYGGLGFAALMIAFIPIHVFDLFRDHPVVGSKAIAIGRLAIQFVLIYTGWWIYKLPQAKQEMMQ